MQLPLNGDKLTVFAFGKTLTVARNSSGRDYHAFIEKGGRTRFGNAAEIRQDVAYFMESGNLPPRSPVAWH